MQAARLHAECNRNQMVLKPCNGDLQQLKGFPDNTVIQQYGATAQHHMSNSESYHQLEHGSVSSLAVLICAASEQLLC
jgi:hypothetical protein